MYRCELCGTVVPSGTPERRVVVLSRPKSYPFRAGAHREIERLRGQPHDAGHHTNDPGGRGREIVHEARVCERCGMSS